MQKFKLSLSTTTISWPLCAWAYVSLHPQVRTKGFCYSKVLHYRVVAAALQKTLKLNYTFCGSGTLLKCGPCFVCEPQSYTTAPGSYLRHGLLLAVHNKVVKGHTLWHTLKTMANNAKTALQLEKNGSPNDTAYILYFWGPRKVHSGFILLV